MGLNNALRIVSKRHVLLLTVVALTLVVAIVNFASASSKPSKGSTVEVNSSKVTAATIAKAARNASLGFGEIVYISMPYRSDRQDALKIISAYSGIKMKLIPGVDGSTMDPKEAPDNLPRTFRPSMLGCWRAHANAWQYMLDANIETMLILEDDIDWDKNVHQVFERLSVEMQTNNPLRLEPLTAREKEAAPYGLDWDVLMVGHCKDVSNPDRLDLAYSYDDPNAPVDYRIEKKFQEQMRALLGADEISGKRIISPTFEPVCTMGYAITRLGAIRLLTELSYLGLHAAVDTEIANRMKEGKLRGYTITPPIFNAWRVRGWKDTDIQVYREYDSVQGKGNRGGKSQNLKTSVRKQLLEDIRQDNWQRYLEKIPPPEKKGAAATAT